MEITIGDNNMVSPIAAMKSPDEYSRALSSRIIFTFSVIFCVSPGCALVKLKKEVKQVQASSILVGHISADFNARRPVIVVGEFDFAIAEK